MSLFLDTVKVRSFRLCMVVSSIELSAFVSSLMTLFQSHKDVRMVGLQVLFVLFWTCMCCFSICSLFGVGGGGCVVYIKISMNKLSLLFFLLMLRCAVAVPWMEKVKRCTSGRTATEAAVATVHWAVTEAVVPAPSSSFQLYVWPSSPSPWLLFLKSL